MVNTYANKSVSLLFIYLKYNQLFKAKVIAVYCVTLQHKFQEIRCIIIIRDRRGKWQYTSVNYCCINEMIHYLNVVSGNLKLNIIKPQKIRAGENAGEFEPKKKKYSMRKQ
jgi:hypothetical protein